MEAKGVQFCVECNNLLLSREDKSHKQLIYLCRSCEYIEYADPNDQDQNSVFQMNYNYRTREDVHSYVVKGLCSDPTLPRDPNRVCRSCSSIGSVYFQLPESVADDAMTLVHVCPSCMHYETER
eukprot:GHVP01030988.1.p1 GENE.GHVP01030988.1~~GHVP01030988.1.p1  ORF type:complete len:124 (+),score=8.68 GHVP01030988.1:55-426(+)